jgi:hypothetical protein
MLPVVARTETRTFFIRMVRSSAQTRTWRQSRRCRYPANRPGSVMLRLEPDYGARVTALRSSLASNALTAVPTCSLLAIMRPVSRLISPGARGLGSCTAQRPFRTLWERVLCIVEHRSHQASGSIRNCGRETSCPLAVQPGYATPYHQY